MDFTDGQLRDLDKEAEHGSPDTAAVFLEVTCKSVLNKGPHIRWRSHTIKLRQGFIKSFWFVLHVLGQGAWGRRGDLKRGLVFLQRGYVVSDRAQAKP